MTESESIVDWNALVLNEGIRLVAGVLRRHLQTRLFAISAGGDCVDVTPRRPRTDSVFDDFVDTDARWGEEDSRMSMIETRRRWVQLLEGAEFEDDGGIDRLIVETDPGFTAHVFPVSVDGERVGGIVVSGFVPAEKAASRVESIREVLPPSLKRGVEESDGPRIVQLDRGDRLWLDRLGSAISEEIATQLEDDDSSPVDESGERFQDMIAASDAMKALFRKIEKVADTDATVLITGENGTGKELVARAVHQLSDRREAPFLAINCAAIPADLIASELFGHVKGAFSGAHQDREGLFEAADGGTLLLDEIGDMEKSLQTKLLRVLQEGTLVRVGDTEQRSVDVRVLCATNSDLAEMVRSGQFRRDLYFRLRVIEMSVPPLRERRGDIELLANHFASEAARRHGTGPKRLSDDCLDQLLNYDWPGNVRELENEIERLVLMSGAEEDIGDELLRPPVSEAEPREPELDFEGRQLPDVIEMIERKMILEGLQNTGWNKTQTAKDLGVSRRNLIRKVKRYELEQHRDD